MTSFKERPVRIVGVPMDLGASRRGTDLGPGALRVAGVRKCLKDIGFDVQRDEDVHVPAMETRASFGDPHARFLDEILQVCEDLAAVVKRALDEGATPLVFGGDHSIGMGTVAGVAGHYRAKKEKIGLIWFDAHGDMNVPTSSPSGNIHGMPLAHIIGNLDGVDDALANIAGFRNKVGVENVALVGLRDIDPEEARIIRESGVHTWTMRDIDEKGMPRVAKEVLEVVNDGTSGFHLSFDVDGLDPSVVAGVGTPVPGGVGFREAHLMLEIMADSGLMTSMEVTELNPLLDNRNAGAKNMLHLITSAFGKSIL
ncbi:MAG: arginase [Planctomycetes bacterium]|nr:arginase [Planctomycetota bacterium]MCP4771668.1 arginase [Planctomycetota bacterium]MCP4860032.1 arginase [Planctomycetota bacterium]